MKRFVPALLLTAGGVVGLVACDSEADSSSTPERTVEQARDNLIESVDSMVVPSLRDKFRFSIRTEPTKSGCSGAMSGDEGPPYRWTLVYFIDYSPEADAYARQRIAELKADGWREKYDERDKWDQTWQLYNDEGVMISVGIPKPQYINQGTPPTSRGIGFGGTSECAG